MPHYWNVVLVHHPLGMLWPLVVLAIVVTAVIGTLRRRRQPPRWLVRANMVLWIGGLLGVVMSVVGEIACAGLVAEETQCRSALKELAAGILMYSQDWDERLPPSDRWFDVVRAKAGEGTLPHPCPAYSGTYAYAMNRLVAGLPLARIEAPADTVFLVEHPCRRPNETTTTMSPQAYRHGQCTNVAFVDGATKRRCTNHTAVLRWEPEGEAKR